MTNALTRWWRRLHGAGPPGAEPRPPAEPEAVLAVCIGNICRSPMAEALLRHALADKAPGTVVESAGVGALVGHPADPIAVDLMRERGLDISDHCGRQVSPEMLKAFPLVLVMDGAQRDFLVRRWRWARGQIWRIGEWEGFDVPDPVGRDRAAFEVSLALIERGIRSWLERVWTSN